MQQVKFEKHHTSDFARHLGTYTYINITDFQIRDGFQASLKESQGYLIINLGPKFISQAGLSLSHFQCADN